MKTFLQFVLFTAAAPLAMTVLAAAFMVGVKLSVFLLAFMMILTGGGL